MEEGEERKKERKSAFGFQSAGVRVASSRVFPFVLSRRGGGLPGSELGSQQMDYRMAI